MVENREAPSRGNSDEHDFDAIPDDFPRSVRVGAVPGAQPKFLMVKYKDHFYEPGTSPPEVYERWEVCEDLAAQLADKSVRSKTGKRAHLSEAEILDQYLTRLVAQHWTSEAEAKWTIRRAAQILNWPVPSAAMEA